MLLPESRSFIEKVVKRVHFIPDRYEIEKELIAHLEDSALYLQDYEGLSPEEAEKAAIERIGNADEIGTALNRQHNPFLGYLWYFSRIIMVLLCVVVVLQFIPMLLLSGWTFLFEHPVNDIPKESYVRHVEPNVLIKLDDTRIRITDVIQTEDGSLHICYSYYSLSFPGYHKWSFGGLSGFKDEDGISYFNGGGHGSAGLYQRARHSLENFPFDKEKLIIEYDNAGRYFHEEIRLGEVKQQ